MKVNFLEIDCGPGGLVWEMHVEDDFIKSYPSEADMLYDAAMLCNLQHEIRFYTQAEYNLEQEMLTMVENEVFYRRLDNYSLSAL